MFLFQETAPTREEKQKLFEGGLGGRKVTFPKNDSPPHSNRFWKRIFQVWKIVEDMSFYDPWWEAGLEKLRMPNNGFTTNYLAAESNLGQACCYVRPIQKDVEMIQLDDKVNQTLYILVHVILTFKQHMLIFSYYGSKYIVHTGTLPKIFW